MISGRYDLPHQDCVMLPAVLRYNDQYTGERQGWIAEALAAENMWVRRNPRPIESAEQVREILELAR